MPIRRPARGWRKGAGNYWPEFVCADGRRARRWLGVVADDRGSFGTKSLSFLTLLFPPAQKISGIVHKYILLPFGRIRANLGSLIITHSLGIGNTLIDVLRISSSLLG